MVFKLRSHLAVECIQYVLTKGKVDDEEEEEEFKEDNAFEFMELLTSCDLDMIMKVQVSM
jgi:hypothetical protein